jgi:hypothetical protein
MLYIHSRMSLKHLKTPSAGLKMMMESEGLDIKISCNRQKVCMMTITLEMKGGN